MNIWDELSKVYNMPGIPDEAMSIIGDVMLAWSESQGVQPEQRSFSRSHEDDRSAEPCEERLISLRAAIDAVKEVVVSAEWEYAEEALERLPSAQPEPQWIPCSERLPEDKSEVLIQFKHNMAVGNLRTDEEVWCISSGDNWETPVLDDDGKPIAWMPLPEPYREEGGE